MTLSPRALSVSIGFLSLAVLAGCQTTPHHQDKPVSANEVPKHGNSHNDYKDIQLLIEQVYSEPNEYIRSWKLPKLPVHVLNRYHWQLVEIDHQNTVSKIDTKQPLTMDVRPNNVVFEYGCQRYRVEHSGYSDYYYSTYNVSNIGSPDCVVDTAANVSHSELLRQLQSDSLESYFKTAFPRYGRGRFNYELRSPQPNTYQLALKLFDKTLVFKGTPKTMQPISGLPITHELLKGYRWRLVSATDKDKKTIAALSRPDTPVTAYFGYPTYNDEHHVGFGTDCNGVGGPYVLTSDHILLIGSGAQTMMGCTPNREAAEDKIREVEQTSRSQLSLEKHTVSDKKSVDTAYYLLTQQLDAGETLIWKSEPITPSFSINDNNE